MNRSQLIAAAAGTTVVVGADTYRKNTDSQTAASRWTRQDGRWATSSQLAGDIAEAELAAELLQRDWSTLATGGTFV